MATTKTAVLSTRVPRDVYLKVKYYAEKRGMNISDWLKPIVLRALNPGKRYNTHKRESKPRN